MALSTERIPPPRPLMP